MGSRTSLTLYEGMNGMMENTFLNVKNKSKTISAEIEIPKGGASGALLLQGGRYGGWSLHLRDGKPAYEYNWLGLERYVVESPTALPSGKATVTLNFTYDGGGPGKGGLAKLLVNGKLVAEGRIGKTQGFIFSADETADVGLDNQTPVALGIGYGPVETNFNGTIHTRSPSKRSDRPGAGGRPMLSVNGKRLTEVRIPKSLHFAFFAVETVKTRT